MVENEVARGLFAALSLGHSWARKNISSLIQWARTAAASLGTDWIFSVNLSIFLLMVVLLIIVLCVIIFDPLQAHNWLLICYSKVALSYRVIIVQAICSSAPSRLSIRIPLSVALWNRHGREYQTVGKRQTHKSSCSSVTSCWAHPGAWKKYRSITQSSLVSDLWASLSRNLISACCYKCGYYLIFASVFQWGSTGSVR